MVWMLPEQVLTAAKVSLFASGLHKVQDWCKETSRPLHIANARAKQAPTGLHSTQACTGGQTALSPARHQTSPALLTHSFWVRPQSTACHLCLCTLTLRVGLQSCNSLPLPLLCGLEGQHECFPKFHIRDRLVVGLASAQKLAARIRLIKEALHHSAPPGACRRTHVFVQGGMLAMSFPCE